jgi:hypothetical protein
LKTEEVGDEDAARVTFWAAIRTPFAAAEVVDARVEFEDDPGEDSDELERAEETFEDKELVGAWLLIPNPWAT